MGKFRFLLILLTTGGIFFDVFFLRGSLDLAVFFLITCWAGTIIFFRFKPKAFFVAALILLLFGLTASLFNQDLTFLGSVVERVSRWVYLFLVIGAVQQMFLFVGEKKQ